MTSSTKQRKLLEISVGSLERALAAQRGGADRIELCVGLEAGGLTPDDELAKAVRAQVHIPIFAMVRPRAGDFLYSNQEYAAMRSSIENAKQLHLDGVVLGILTEESRVDVPRTRALVELAGPLDVTFHRAFDECRDLQSALEDVIATGAKRILTSGGAGSALEGARTLANLVAAAADRINILPGAGISADNIQQMARQTGAQEFHSGLSSVLPYSSKDCQRFETEVRKLAEKLSFLS